MKGFIGLTPEVFVKVLDIIVKLSRNTAQNILAKDPSKWVQEAELEDKMKTTQMPAVMQQDTNFYDFALEQGFLNEFEKVVDTALELDLECEGFRESKF